MERREKLLPGGLPSGASPFRSLKSAWHRSFGLLQGLLGASLNGRDTVALQVQRHAAQQPHHPCLQFEAETWTYAEFNQEVNRHAHAYAALGVSPGDVVALMMENRPQFLFHVLGLHKLGAVASLLNSHVRGPALLHALGVAEPKHLVLGSELESVWTDVSSHYQGRVLIDVDAASRAPTQGLQTFQALTADANDKDPISAGQQRLGQLAAYIFTSGTTGKPKAARISHQRMYRAAATWGGLALRYRADDVMYNCLPLYHSNGLMLATCSAFSAGVTLALARRFSSREFWNDVRRHRATSFIYIGELCRYLLSMPPQPNDQEHSVRVISGNGMQEALWREFKARFGIRHIVEFYAATEGNCVTINVFEVPGAVGPMLPHMALVRWDADEERIIRDRRGLAVPARHGEPGLLLGRIAKNGLFEGYEDATATEAKVVRNVRAPGDQYFNTGDLLRRRKGILLHFVDRLGDTFRWKGENVATLEVQQQLLRHSTLQQALVYGVQVPGTEGRAGMAALVVGDGRFDASEFARFVDRELPSYARPLFLRIVSELTTTSTLKLRPTELKKDGFDPDKCNGDGLWVRLPREAQYTSLTTEVFAAIMRGEYAF